MNYGIMKVSLWTGFAGITACGVLGLLGCHHRGMPVEPTVLTTAAIAPETPAPAADHHAATPLKRVPVVHEQSPTAADEGVAVSLKVLADQVVAGAKRGVISDDAVTLGGISEVAGYVLDMKQHDIVLLGRVKKGAVKLDLDDLIVALCNAYMEYAVQKGNTLEYSPPGVSIDPNPATLTDLNRIEQRIFQSGDHQIINAGLKKWSQVAQGPQNTRILGMPRAHLSAVALSGDYEMKRIVDGSEKVAGITSLTDLRYRAGRGGPGGSLNRFWFVSRPDPTFVQDDGIILFQSCPVSLLTEAEALVNRNTIAGSGQADPIAAQFCQTFSQHMKEIEQRKVYAELANGFRWVALATMMKRQDVFTQSGLSPFFYLKGFAPAEYNIPATLPGIANIREIRSATTNAISYNWLMTVGGVDMGVNIPATNILPDQQGILRVITKAALATRPPTPALWWRFHSPALARVSRM